MKTDLAPPLTQETYPWQVVVKMINTLDDNDDNDNKQVKSCPSCSNPRERLYQEGASITRVD